MGSCDDDRSQAPSVADNDEAEEQDDGTVDAREERQDIWAQAEGYTPLADIQYSSLMVNMEPSDSDDEDENENEDGVRNSNTGGGAFFVNPSAFDMVDSGIEGGADQHRNELPSERLEVGISNAVSGVDEHAFDDIASKALSLLDEEYERTLKAERRSPICEGEISKFGSCGSVSSQDMPGRKTTQEEEDLKAIAAAFDKRKEAYENLGFVADWDNIPPLTQPKNLPQSVADANVDADALRRVVRAISENSQNPFQKKFAAWNERQQPLPPTHELIHITPYKAFRRNSEKAKRATASLSRSATLAEAMRRLRQRELLPIDEPTLVIDVVGVDHVECETIERIQTTFQPIARWLGVWKGCLFQHLQLRLIGRDLVTEIDAPVDLLTPKAATIFSTAVATCHQGVYHTWLSELGASGRTPHLAIAYNSGIWGYNEWKPTIQYLCQQSSSPAIPFISTAYTLEECQEDYEVIYAAVAGNGKAEVLWGAQQNPFGSKIIRETKSRSNEYRENAAWQAWLLGGASAK